MAFTGSTRVGKEVARAAAGHLARTTLELGGKSAQLVFDDASLAAARDGVMAGIFAATGQTCIAGSRLLVHRAVKDELVSALADRARTIVLGDPLDAASEMGPLANAQQLETVRGHIERAVGEGARGGTGGDDGGKGGLFLAPTIIDASPPTWRWPTRRCSAPCSRSTSSTTRTRRSRRPTRRASASPRACGPPMSVAPTAWRPGCAPGTVWVNSYRVVAPQVPFGGVGDSGWGRESGLEAMHSFTETKAVWIELEGQTRDPFRMG